MRALIAILGATACGSVSFEPDTQPVDAQPSDGALAPGDTRWVRSLSAMIAVGIADGPGGLVVAGSTVAPCNLGMGPMTPAGMADQVFAAFDVTTGALIYQVRNGRTGSESGNVDIVDFNASPLVFGNSSGTLGDVDLGLGPVDSGGNGASDGYIGRYGPGAPAWVQRLVGTGVDMFLGTARGPRNTAYVIGELEDGARWNGSTLTSNGGRDVFLSRVASFNGAVDLTRTYGGGGADTGTSVASNGDDTVVIAGDFDDTISFGGATTALSAVGGRDLFVAKLDSNGDGIWARRFGGSGSDGDPRLALDAVGDVYVTGGFTGEVGLGGVNLISNGERDIFVAKLRGADGTVVWATSFGSKKTDAIRKIAVDHAGHVAISGAVIGPIDGRAVLGGAEGFVASFEAATGASRFFKLYSTEGDDFTVGLAYGADGDLYTTLFTSRPFDFGQPVIGVANPTTVLLRLAP